MDRKGRSGNLDGERVGGQRFDGALAMVKGVGFGIFFFLKNLCEFSRMPRSPAGEGFF